VAWCGHWDIPFLARLAKERRWSFAAPTWDIRQLAALAEGQQADWLVVDSYEPAPDWFPQWRRTTTVRVMALVDDPAVTLDVDLLLNQNLDAEAGHGGSLHGTSLRGSPYALVRAALVAARSLPRPPSGAPWRVLLMMGGGDPSGWTLRAGRWLGDMDARLEVTVLAPAHVVAAVSALATPHRLRVSPPRSDVEILMAQSHLVVSAAGSTCWELCALGVPMCLLVVAENQRPIANALQGHGVATLLDGSLGPEDTSRFTSMLDASVLEDVGSRLKELVDGQGPARVVAAMGRMLDGGVAS
jgi:spore coat polysaccharide biosynthesis predicted glycosyltransferase SpsG